MGEERHLLYICSDSVGGTAEKVAEATIKQFSANQIVLKKYAHIRHEDEIKHILETVKTSGGFVAYTLVQPELREMMKAESIRVGVRAVDIMGPMMQAFVDVFGSSPKQKPGLLHEMDEAYFHRVEAIEFAVKYDDGRDARGLTEAQLILIGVSRTSKTPLSIFLAHKGIKVANLPIMPEVKLPEELFRVASTRIIGLTMEPEALLRIRVERLKAMGLPQGANYATLQRIQQESDYALALMEKLRCTKIDVSSRAIEETAAIIMEHLQS